MVSAFVYYELVVCRN